MADRVRAAEGLEMAAKDRAGTPGNPVLRELFREQLPLVAGLFACGLVVSSLVYGYIPGAERPFPVAGVRVPVWHLVWAGFWTGYVMALVGEGCGLLALPYTMSILRFGSVSVSPTSLITTFLNPIGALLGYRRERQWNFDLALWLCLGGLLGVPAGPFLRVHFLSDPVPFKALVGLCLFFVAIHVALQATPWYLRKAGPARRFKERFDALARECVLAGKAPCGLPPDFRIVTLERNLRRVRIGYCGEEQTFSVPVMLCIGFGIGVLGATIGMGGGFVLVPILVSFYRLPMYVVVAASMPFVVILSAAGLLSYIFLLPALSGAVAQPDWAFGCFLSSGAVLGSWLASKTQKLVPESCLKPLLGVMTGVIGLLYVLNFLVRLPFRV